MLIARGKLKGRQAKLVQFANDWISADLLPEGKPLILNPTSVQLEDGEYAAMQEHSSVGQFWAWYHFDPVGQRFIKARPR